MLGKLFKSGVNCFPFLNPFIFDEINRFGSIRGVNDDIKREVPVIVTLTSERENFNRLHITLYSLLNQTFKPDKILLWLDEDTEDLSTLPYEITRFLKNGLEIRFVKYKKTYTKQIYAFKEFKNAIIVTAEDNVYYRKNWLKKLYYSYISSPENIHVHCAGKIRAESDKIFSIENIKNVSKESAEYNNFLIGAGGVLYPPNCFTKEALREDIFLKYVPDNGDIWFWVMSLTHNRKIRVVKNHYAITVYLSFWADLLKPVRRCQSKKAGDDKQLQSLMKYYKQNIISKIS